MSLSTGIPGLVLLKGHLDSAAQEDFLAQARDIARAAPMFTPVTRSGRMRVSMTSAGRVGWVADKSGYRYAEMHPDGRPWPAIPQLFLDLWQAVSGADRAPETCLVNYYGDGAKMGLHQDRNEADFSQPVVSISLGDTAVFRIGGTERGGPTRAFALESGDVMVMGGAARLRFHGIDRIRFGSSRLLQRGGRINLTLRVVS